MEEVPFTLEERKKIEKIQNDVNKTTSKGCFILIPIISFLLYFLIFFEISHPVFSMFSFILTLFGVWVITTILNTGKQIASPLIQKDIQEGITISGESKVVEKIEDLGSDSNYYGLKFDDERIKIIFVYYSFWEKVKVGDTFYIEQSKHYKYIFNFVSNRISYLNKITNA